MKKITVTSRLEAPLEAVFTAFTDLEHAAQRVAGIKAVEILTPGEFHYGTRWQESREILGHIDSSEMEVTAFERNRSYTVTHHKGGARIDTVFTFTPVGDATQVSVEFALENESLIPGLFAPVGWAIAGKVKEAIAHDLSDMKKSVEA